MFDLPDLPVHRIVRGLFYCQECLIKVHFCRSIYNINSMGCYSYIVKGKWVVIVPEAVEFGRRQPDLMMLAFRALKFPF